MMISGGNDRVNAVNSEALILRLQSNYWRLAAQNLMSAEESEAMAFFIRDIQNLQQQLESCACTRGKPMDRETGLRELEGMVKILRDDIDLVRMRQAV